jgi:hypothetical protein|tara:strand:- start:1571 stop:1876 length:306 start_codon:yes stop_codon:yes gene_type:complete
MLNLNKVNRNALMSIGSLVLIIFILSATRNTSMYQPMPIDINVVTDKPMSELENKIECTPGRKKGSAYTRGLTPGGICGAQEHVAKFAAYEIIDGIGGSLI